MAVILGIDPGLQHTGWGVIKAEDNRLHYVACGVVSTRANEPLATRLAYLSEKLSAVISLYHPETCAIEETFVNKNPLSSLKLGHARGALMLTASLAGLTVHEYAATLVKKSLVGGGRAEKVQVQMMVKRLLPTAVITGEDAGDALAIAVCHAHHVQSLRYVIH